MKCHTIGCGYIRHTDEHSMGGYCCKACKNNAGAKHGPRCQAKDCVSVRAYAKLKPRNAQNRTSALNLSDLAGIYQFPSATSTTGVVVGILSFGGGLFGNFNSQGVMTTETPSTSDVLNLWRKEYPTLTNFPRVIIVPVDGAINRPNANDGGSTLENTMDVSIVGGCWPNPNLTILLYLGTPKSSFTSLLRAALSSTRIQGTTYTPSILSISWGLPELYGGKDMQSANALMQTAASKGITICVATGDTGSSDGLSNGKNVDFPSSSPYCVAVGGTTLAVKDPSVSLSATTWANYTETAWSGSGGGVSKVFPKPSWQSALAASGRSTPDLAAVADPKTGCKFLLRGNTRVVGGTSMAAPLVASFFAANNLTTFANSVLYTLPSSNYHDITSGSNGAYKSKVGYDNCTGIGSINGTNLCLALPKNSTVPNVGLV